MAESSNNAAHVSIWPTVWKFSIILAAISFVYTICLYLTGLAGSTGMGLLSMVISIVVLVIGLRKYRGLNNGVMTFGTATLTSFMISVTASVINSLLNFLYLSLIDDSTLTAMYDQTMAAMQQSPGMNPQAMEMMSGFYKALFTPGGMFISGIISGIIGGIIIALILAAILKKDQPITAR
jgi:hypothetical protein